MQSKSTDAVIAKKSTEVVDLEFFIACTLIGITALLWLANYLSSLA